MIDKGIWPEGWPKELDPVRKQARTYEGPKVLNRHYLIPFTSREEFEAAWPHFLKVKAKGAPIILLRGPKTDFMEIKPAGLIVHTPPVDRDKRANAEAPIPGQGDVMNATSIELVVDGNIVDLNRIPLPADTPIVDERFRTAPPAAEKQASSRGGGRTPGADGAPAAAPEIAGDAWQGATGVRSRHAGGSTTAATAGCARERSH